MNDFLSVKLEKRAEENLLRKLSFNENLIDFCSNDYLGLSQHPELKNFHNASLASGATGSRLISGNSGLAEETEDIIAKYHHAEAALIFNCGYMANTGLLSSVATKNDTIICDEFVHASITDGIRLSNATRSKFRHNDLNDLEKKIRNAEGRKFVVVESLYSMDGDLAPLKEINSICKKYDALLIVDEAHSTGVYGENGKGIVCELGLEDDVFARIHTFGKALGLHGAAVLGSETLRNFLINHSRSFIFTTALPPQTYLHLQKAFELLPCAKRNHLFKLIAYFKEKAQEAGEENFILHSSPILGIRVAGNENAGLLAEHLTEKGFFVKPIRYPTVPKNTERIRICLHSFNTENEIDALFEALKSFNR